jgi:hypothetical protein
MTTKPFDSEVIRLIPAGRSILAESGRDADESVVSPSGSVARRSQVSSCDFRISFSVSLSPVGAAMKTCGSDLKRLSSGAARCQG